MGLFLLFFVYLSDIRGNSYTQHGYGDKSPEKKRPAALLKPSDDKALVGASAFV